MNQTVHKDCSYWTGVDEELDADTQIVLDSIKQNGTYVPAFGFSDCVSSEVNTSRTLREFASERMAKKEREEASRKAMVFTEFYRMGPPKPTPEDVEQEVVNRIRCLVDKKRLTELTALIANKDKVIVQFKIRNTKIQIREFFKNRCDLQTLVIPEIAAQIKSHIRIHFKVRGPQKEKIKVPDEAKGENLKRLIDKMNQCRPWLVSETNGRKIWSGEVRMPVMTAHDAIQALKIQEASLYRMQAMLDEANKRIRQLEKMETHK